MRAAVLLAMLALAACAPRQAAAPVAGIQQRWVAVLVAGDGSLPVFDNATGKMMALLEASGTPEQDIHRLSVAPDVLAQPKVQVASRARVLEAVAALRPGPGQACLVFLTSHGAHGPGLYLAPRREFLSPVDLDAALSAGCGSAPTVAIVSACYTGDFAAAPMAAPNRIILTAARADRPSFGCGAGRELAFYDSCLLAGLAASPGNWASLVGKTDDCVAKLEASDHERPSDPQSTIGASVAALPVVGG
jgi:hypothetical protein